MRAIFAFIEGNLASSRRTKLAVDLVRYVRFLGACLTVAAVLGLVALLRAVV